MNLLQLFPRRETAQPTLAASCCVGREISLRQNNTSDRWKDAERVKSQHRSCSVYAQNLNYAPQLLLELNECEWQHCSDWSDAGKWLGEGRFTVSADTYLETLRWRSSARTLLPEARRGLDRLLCLGPYRDLLSRRRLHPWGEARGGEGLTVSQVLMESSAQPPPAAAAAAAAVDLPAQLRVCVVIDASCAGKTSFDQNSAIHLKHEPSVCTRTGVGKLEVDFYFEMHDQCSGTPLNTAMTRSTHSS